MLQVRDISYNYSKTSFKGLRNVSLRLSAGEILAVVGKSGSGKTTLLKCVYGLEDLHGGEIELDGEPVLGPAYNLIPGHANMRFVSQDFYVLDNHTVLENIIDKLAGYTDEYKRQRSNTLLELLELKPLKDTRAIQLSSGQKQRVAIARALAVLPSVLLLDEPFSNLDHILTAKLFTFICKEVKKKKCAVILITHLAEEALKYADRIAVMDQGRIVESGDKWQVYYSPRYRRLAGLLGEYNLVRRSDLLNTSTRKKSKTEKIFARPDNLRITRGAGDLHATVDGCTYNGRCYEITASLQGGSSVLIYSAQPVKAEKELRLEFAVPSGV